MKGLFREDGRARAVNRFDPTRDTFYQSKSMRDAPLRHTREEATRDELAWLNGTAPDNESRTA